MQMSAKALAPVESCLIYALKPAQLHTHIKVKLP